MLEDLLDGTSGISKDKGFYVRGVGIKRPEFSPSYADEFLLLDLRKLEALKAVNDMDYVFRLAADMRGIGYITKIVQTLCMTTFYKHPYVRSFLK
ncbi:hypothetical protein DRH29_05740 [candidate division Kazan bacterium]|uniref:Uncharacterized protein n=1 Tax=candidate division Kazan bacterium TaxID=2202143 RepID=A0A420ZB21_UNCK3|nr:MAG: hypothetical protein DRH29_05740 [candidate division Kazan bacterium]